MKLIGQAFAPLWRPSVRSLFLLLLFCRLPALARGRFHVWSHWSLSFFSRQPAVLSLTSFLDRCSVRTSWPPVAPSVSARTCQPCVCFSSSAVVQAPRGQGRLLILSATLSLAVETAWHPPALPEYSLESMSSNECGLLMKRRFQNLPH